MFLRCVCWCMCVWMCVCVCVCVRACVYVYVQVCVCVSMRARACVSLCVYQTIAPSFLRCKRLLIPLTSAKWASCTNCPLYPTSPPPPLCGGLSPPPPPTHKASWMLESTAKSSEREASIARRCSRMSIRGMASSCSPVWVCTHMWDIYMYMYVDVYMSMELFEYLSINGVRERDSDGAEMF